MTFFNYKALSFIIAVIAINTVSAQPAYFNGPPPGYMPPPGQMYPGYMPPPNFNRGYPPPYYRNSNYGNPHYGNQNMRNQGFSNNRFGNMPFNRFGNNPFNNFNGPWNDNSANYGPDTRWFTDTPRRWMRHGPKEGAGQVFDDFLDAPSRMGDMPGGWSAPTISVPNPIDVADELERGSRDMFNNN